MNEFLIRKILNEQEINHVKKLIDISNKNNFWQDGLESTYSNSKKLKNNLELNNSQIINEVNSIIMNNLDKDINFLNFTIPIRSGTIIISKTKSGGYYNPHMDYHTVGDYSTTIFLNNPEEYDGGELCLYVGDEEKKIKLSAGYGITYSTGLLHRVNTVTSGNRYASIFWTHSSIKDPFNRMICSQLNKIAQILSKDKNYNYSEKSFNSWKETIENPHFIAENLYNIMMRKYK